jgi:hypothetical protein
MSDTLPCDVCEKRVPAERVRLFKVSTGDLDVQVAYRRYCLECLATLAGRAPAGRPAQRLFAQTQQRMRNSLAQLVESMIAEHREMEENRESNYVHYYHRNECGVHHSACARKTTAESPRSDDWEKVTCPRCLRLR